LAFDAMIDAGKEEAALAVMENNVNEKGIPLITVIADGAWSKRSYKSGKNTLSGIVSILSDFLKKLFRSSIIFFFFLLDACYVNV